MQHGIPVGVLNEVAFQFAQYFRRKYKYEDYYFKGVRQLDLQLPLKERRQHKQHQYQQTHEHTLIFLQHGGAHQHCDNQKTQYYVYCKHLRPLFCICPDFFHSSPFYVVFHILLHINVHI